MSLNYRIELEKARMNIQDRELTGNADTLEAYMEVCCGIILLAEENIMDTNCREWENAGLVREFLSIATRLEDYDHLLDSLHACCERLEETLFEHPRLKVELMKLHRSVLNRICVLHEPGPEGLLEDICHEISEHESNIFFADRMQPDMIRNTGHLKKDPVEWTAEYENAIDDVHRKAYENLSGHPHGMGFCFAFWIEKSRILLSEYNIEWKSPQQMNPNVLFD